MTFKNAQASSPAPGDPLRDHFLKKYPRRKRASKYLGAERPFNVADPEPTDTWKWSISAGVLDADPPRLALILHSVPQDQALLHTVAGIGGLVIPDGEHASLVLQFPADDTLALRNLAGAIRAVQTTKWQWLSNKMADALVGLAIHLDQLRQPPAATSTPGPVKPTGP